MINTQKSLISQILCPTSSINTSNTCQMVIITMEKNQAEKGGSVGVSTLTRLVKKDLTEGNI